MSWRFVFSTIPVQIPVLNSKQRLDAILRSSVYSHFSESLSGLATIRAYGETERFLKDNERRIDIENRCGTVWNPIRDTYILLPSSRAYWLTISNQRWLDIRLDFLGITLTFVVAILTVAARFSISPSQTGVTLSYILLVQQVRLFNCVSSTYHWCNICRRSPSGGWSVRALKSRTTWMA